MRNFNIDFIGLSDSKKDDIRSSMLADVELELSLKGEKVDSLKVAEIVDSLINRTFSCRAEVGDYEVSSNE